MISAGISELSLNVNIFILAWGRKENDPVLENVHNIVFRLVNWKNQKKPEIRNSVARENI